MSSPHFREWLGEVTKPRQMLLIDDSAEDTEIILAKTADFHATWTTARNYEEALERVEARNFNLVVLDLRLEGAMTGVEVFRKIKERRSLLPIVILSGFITTEVVAQITHIGFAMFAVKPAVFDSAFFEQLFLTLNIPKQDQTSGATKSQNI